MYVTGTLIQHGSDCDHHCDRDFDHPGWQGPWLIIVTGTLTIQYYSDFDTVWHGLWPSIVIGILIQCDREFDHPLWQRPLTIHCYKDFDHPVWQGLWYSVAGTLTTTVTGILTTIYCDRDFDHPVWQGLWNSVAGTLTTMLPIDGHCCITRSIS